MIALFGRLTLGLMIPLAICVVVCSSVPFVLLWMKTKNVRVKGDQEWKKSGGDG